MKDKHVIELDEGQRQLVIHALAELSLRNPGWIHACEEICFKMDNKVDGKAELFESFRRTRTDVVAEVLAGDPIPYSTEPGYPTQTYGPIS